MRITTVSLIMKTEQFGANLRLIRLKKGFSQSTFAATSGFTQSQVSDFETGRRTPSLANLFRLRSALDCSWNELLTITKKTK